MLYWHCNGSISQSGQKSRCPHSRITSAKGYLIAFPDAAVLEDDVYFLYLARHVVELQGSSLIVSKRVFVPIIFYNLLY